MIETLDTLEKLFHAFKFYVTVVATLLIKKGSIWRNTTVIIASIAIAQV